MCPYDHIIRNGNYRNGNNNESVQESVGGQEVREKMQ